MHPLIKAHINLALLQEIEPRAASPYWPIWRHMVNITREFIRDFKEEWPCPTIEYATEE
jgi:hypothetical protein